MAIALLGGCGGNDEAPPEQRPTTGLSHRALVVNEFFNRINVLNAETDRGTFQVISTGSQPRFTVVSPQKAFTLVFNAGSNSVTYVDNEQELEIARFGLPDWTEMILISPDGKLAYAPIRNANRVHIQDINAGTSSSIDITAVRRLAMNPAGSLILAFSDESDAVTVIKTEDKSTSTLAGFDRPINAVFSSDGQLAFVLNCGPECGGTTASVQVVDMSTTPPTLGANIVVSAATVALLDGSKLYVAGTAGGSGMLDVIDTGTLTVSKSGVAISDGFHHEMALGANGKLFIAARTCSAGCLSIFNTSAQTAVIGSAKGEVTGLQPITGRDVVYVAEGGEFRVYSTTTDEEVDTGINVTGFVSDVAEID